MRIYEIVSQKFFLFTNTAQPEGKTIALDDAACDFGPEIEDRLEKMRPDNQPARSTTIRISTIPTASEYVYAVSPLDDVVRSHLGWIKMLRDSDPLQGGVMDHLAQGYWSGKECGEARDEDWEYRAPKLKILRRIGGSANSR